MTLRARLLLALLGLALIPTLVFTVFTFDQLGRWTNRWFSPGVDRALASALEVSRTLLTRLDADVQLGADRWAPLAHGPLDAKRRAHLRDELRDAGLDFFQIYRREDTRWTLLEQLVPERTLAAEQLDLSAEIDSSLRASHVLHSARGALAGVALADSNTALVAGIRVSPDFFQQIDHVGQARLLYGRLGVVVDLQRRYVWLLIAALVAGLALVTVVLANTLARQMSAPLGELSSALERVAAGDLETRVVPAGADELRRLAHAFNSMTERLASARTALQQAEREAAWRDVARHLAHEIKNPLTPMRLSLHRLQKRIDVVPADQRVAVRDSLEALLNEVEHLTRLAEQFSQYARLPEPRFEPLDLAELTRKSVALHEPEGLTVSITSDGPVPVRGDRLLLSRALHNLLLNACEASPPGGEIEVRTAVEAGNAIVEVLDRGSGLSPALGARVFEPYVSTKNRGSGLGLSLVRDIASQHGGEVTLESRDGGGARARLTLPMLEDNASMGANG